jgi:UDP-N-acetylglucosamine 2-epimerase (non-hydrolysing)
MSRKKTLVTVLGTRPEIVKFSPLLPEFDRHFRHTLIHTGQHYDANMDRIFFKELSLRAPQKPLNVGSGSQAVQTAKMLEGIEPILLKERPDMVAVLGDTNSTLAGALVAAKLNIPVVHVEAGCRSFNLSMPEEKNRILVDHISRYLFTPDKEGTRNLLKEGLPKKSIYEVGNTGLDATRRTMSLASPTRLKRFKVAPEKYVLATIHRAENTDDPSILRGLMEALNHIARETTVLFPIHPRTVAALNRHRIKLIPQVRQLEPIGNLDFVALLRDAVMVLSDSGGVQEEAAVINRPCLILRNDTEWTRLVDAGKNFLVGNKPRPIIREALKLLQSPEYREKVRRRKAPLNFGATQRIIKVLKAG